MNKKQSFAIASTSFLAAGMAHGDIVYSGSISNLLTPSSTTMIDVNGDAINDYRVWFDNSTQLKPFIDCRTSVNPSLNPNAWTLAKTNGGAPVTLFGTMIDSGYAATYPTNKVAYLYEQYNNDTVVGDWPSTANSEGYVGIELTDGSTITNYGWVHLIYNAAPANNKTMMLVDFAYETTPS